MYTSLTNPLRPYAIVSGQRVEIVLGVISPKIRSSTVATRVAIPTPFEPKIPKAISAIIDETKIFTKSLDTKRVLISCSRCSSNLLMRTAFLSLFLRLILSFNLFIPRIELSEMENIMERTIKAIRIIIVYFEG